MSNLKFWIKSCLVLIVSVFRLCVAKDAIGCYHSDAKCQTVLPTCEDTSVIILNDIQWYSKHNCTAVIENCEQCCFYDANDVNRSLSNSESVDIYSQCHRQPGCDPYTDLHPPTGFQTGYLHIIYTCQQVSATEEEDTQTVPVHVIYAVIFPVIGICIIVAIACFMKRKDTGRPKLNEDDENEATSNDVHASTRETKPTEEVFIVSQTSSKQSTNSRNAVKFTPRERELYSPDVSSDGINQTDTRSSNTKPIECTVPVESSDGYTTEEEVTVKEPIYDAINEIAVNDTNTRVASSATENDTLTSQPKKMTTTNANSNAAESFASSRYKKDKKDIRPKQRNTIDRRKMKRVRMKQLQILRNIKLYWRTKQYEHKVSESSSDDYSPTSSSFTESSADSDGDDSEDHNVNYMKSVSRLKDENETETFETKVIGNVIVNTSKGVYASLNGVKNQTARETINETLQSQTVDRLGHQIIKCDDISSDIGSSSGSLHPGNSNKQYIFAHMPPTVTETFAREEYVLENTNTQKQSNMSCNESHVPKEGPIATSSIRYTQDEKMPYVHKYDMAKCNTNDRNKNGNKTPISVWCLPKPPDTKPELQYNAKQSAEILNRSMSLNETDKRRDEVMYKRRKRKYESMRHAKRETIFEILQKLQAVPKGSILKKSKSMNVGKRESETNKRHVNTTDRNIATFEDDSNLTDSDKIHKLIEPQGQLVSEVQSEINQNDKHASELDRLPVYTPTDRSHISNESKPADSVCQIHENNSKDIDTHQCDIISSNLKQNSSVEMDDVVNDADTISDEMNMKHERDAIRSQRQANIRHKLLQKEKYGTRKSLDTLPCHGDFTSKTYDVHHHVPKSYSLQSRTEQEKNASTLLLQNETNGTNHNDTESENDFIGFNQPSANDRFPNSVRHNVPIRHSRRDVTDDSYPLESGKSNKHYSQITAPNRYGSAVGHLNASVSSSLSDPSDDSLTYVTESDKHNAYQIPSRPKSSLGDRSRSNGRHTSEFDKNDNYQIHTRPKSSLGNRSRSNYESDQNDDYQIPTRPQSSLGDHSKSTGSHDSESDKNTDYQIPTRPKSALDNRPRSNGSHDFESNQNNDYQIPYRPKSSLGDRSRLTGRQDSEFDEHTDYQILTSPKSSLSDQLTSHGRNDSVSHKHNENPINTRPKSSFGDRSRSTGSHDSVSDNHNDYQIPARPKSSLGDRSRTNGSLDSEYNIHNDYQVPTRPKSSLADRSMSPRRHDFDFDKPTGYQIPIHPKSPLDSRSRSAGRNDCEFDKNNDYQIPTLPKSSLDNRSRSTESHDYVTDKHNNHQIPIRPKSSLGGRSRSNGSHDSASDKHNDYQIPVKHNDNQKHTRPKSSLGDRSESNRSHDSESDKSSDYKISTRPKSSLGNRSRSNSRNDCEFDLDHDYQAPTRTKSLIDNRSRSTGSHGSVSDRENNDQTPIRPNSSLDNRGMSTGHHGSDYDKYNDNQTAARPKSSLGDRSRSNVSHDLESDEQNDYEIPMRPKTSLGNPSLSTGSHGYLYHYHHQRDEPILQSSRKSKDTNGNKVKETDFKYKLPSDVSHLNNVPNISSRSHDTPTIHTDKTSQSDSLGQKSIDRRNKKRTDHKQRLNSRKDEKAKIRKTINQSLNKIAGVSGQPAFKRMETYDSALTPYSTMPYNLENKDYHTGQYSKTSKIIREQNQPSEINSRPNTYLKKSNLLTHPRNMQEQSADDIVPHRRPKTPTSASPFSNQRDTSSRGSVERNLFTNFESKLPPYSYSGNKSTNNSSKLHRDIDTSFGAREQTRVKSQDEDTVKLLNRRFKDSNRVNENVESKEPVRERPKSAMFGRYGGRSESRSAVQRNKSMSNDGGANIPSVRNGNVYSPVRSSNGESQGTDSSKGMAGWSRWNHPVDIGPDWHRQSTSGTDVLLEEYDSEIENFFSNPDAEVLEINTSPRITRNTRPRTGVSRSKSCKT